MARAMIFSFRVVLSRSVVAGQVKVDALAELGTGEAARVDDAGDLLAQPVIDLGQGVLDGLALHQGVGPGLGGW